MKIKPRFRGYFPDKKHKGVLLAMFAGIFFKYWLSFPKYFHQLFKNGALTRSEKPVVHIISGICTYAIQCANRTLARKKCNFLFFLENPADLFNMMSIILNYDRFIDRLTVVGNP